jgi:uncharacterized protein
VIAYVDSSVIIRLLFGQDGQLDEWAGLDAALASELVRVETLRTIDRAALRAQLAAPVVADLRAAALDLIARLQLAQISSAVLERAGDPFPTSLGTLDAIHLATAITLAADYPRMAMATHDHELAAAARSLGFAILGA